MNTFVKILLTIIAIPFGIAGAVCMVPLAFLCFLVSIPVAIIEDIWCPPEVYKKESEE